ncbi:MAG: hypothetical protein GY820_44290, partial [Gammaproteobacteria bacterium]|nr:hypothetical protein [Gammaproteobacteria bacterium]
GKFTSKLTAKDKERCWKMIMEELVAVGNFCLGERSWEKVRDEIWGYYKQRTQRKLDNQKKVCCFSEVTYSLCLKFVLS